MAKIEFLLLDAERLGMRITAGVHITLTTLLRLSQYLDRAQQAA